MPCITKEQVQSADDLPREKLPTPEWGIDSYLWVRTVSGTERDAFEARMSAQGEAKLVNIRARFAVLVATDDDGAPIFAEADAEWLGGKNAKTLDAIFDVGSRLNGMFKTAQDELRKNSSRGPSAASTSDSPATSAAPSASS